MTSISRRRFLTGLSAGLGVGTVGVLSWLGSRGNGVAGGTSATSTPPSASPPSATTPPTSTTTPPPTTTTSPATTQPPVESVVVIPVICRESWGAQPPIGDFVPHEIDQITVHHTAVLLADDTDAPGRVRQHQAFHQSREWPDLAYHFVIDGAGNVYEGRPVTAVGDTGTDYDPTGHFLVCCEGNFNEQDIPEAQYAALVELVTWGCREFAVEPSAVRGHRDVATTSCPGDNLYPFIADGVLAADVLAVVDQDHRIEVICGVAGDALVAAIESKT